MSNYFIAGDGTGITYGVYKGNMFSKYELVKSGIKSFKECQKYIDELEQLEVKEPKKAKK
jgi:hypothetical protein